MSIYVTLRATLVGHGWPRHNQIRLICVYKYVVVIDIKRVRALFFRCMSSSPSRCLVNNMWGHRHYRLLSRFQFVHFSLRASSIWVSPSPEFIFLSPPYLRSRYFWPTSFWTTSSEWSEWLIWDCASETNTQRDGSHRLHLLQLFSFFGHLSVSLSPEHIFSILT